MWRYRYSVAVCQELPWCCTAIANADFLATAAQGPGRAPILSGCTVVSFLSAELGVMVGTQEMLTSASACSYRGGIQVPQVPSVLPVSLAGCGAGKGASQAGAQLALACHKM